MRTETELIAQAVAEGYPDVDETCSKCQRVFKNYHHFLHCEEDACPMSCGKTLFELMDEASGVELWTENLGSE